MTLPILLDTLRWRFAVARNQLRKRVTTMTGDEFLDIGHQLLECVMPALGMLLLCLLMMGML